MGLDIDREHFDAADYALFSERLRRGLEALRQLLLRPGFGAGPPSIGAELELCLVGPDARPRPVNQDVLTELDDARISLELDRFNLELNTRPALVAGRPFETLRAELEDGLAGIRRAASAHACHVVITGILPTLHARDLEGSAMSDATRYRALSAALRKLREGPFRVEIDGEDPLSLTCDDVTLEGANTALQIHLRVAPERFAATYNAAQLATAPVLAVAGNSPLFLGHRLWEETRVALFKQSIDARGEDGTGWSPPSRVTFGHGWVRRGAHELFAESVALYPPLLPATGDSDPLEALAAGEMPALEELRLHHGTVWRWNRAVYEPSGEGHLRIEMRALPAGPTLVDMLANAAFLVGLTLGLAGDAEALATRMTFGHTQWNFYRAAQSGLAARLLWPSDSPPSPRPVPAPELIDRLLPLAEAGLRAAQVEPEDAGPLLELIAERARSGVTGAVWQRSAFAALCREHPREEALAALLERYVDCSNRGEPVHRWPRPE